MITAHINNDKDYKRLFWALVDYLVKRKIPFSVNVPSETSNNINDFRVMEIMRET